MMILVCRACGHLDRLRANPALDPNTEICCKVCRQRIGFYREVLVTAQRLCPPSGAATRADGPDTRVAPPRLHLVSRSHD